MTTKLKWLKSSLVAHGYEVRAAHNGYWAIRMFKGFGGFDLCITEYRYSSKTPRNGLELIAAIRGIDPLQAFIIQTAETDLAAPLGVPLLRKPYHLHRLLKLIKTPVHPILPLSEQQV